MFCGTCFGEKAGAPNIALFRFKFKVAAAGNDRELVCAAGTGKLVLSFFGSYSVLESAVADRILVAASRFLSAVAACVIRKSYWGGWIKVAMVSSQQILLSIGADHFPLKIPLKKCFKIVFFRSSAEIQFWSCNFCCHGASFYGVLKLSVCRSPCKGCMKVPRCCGCLRNSIVFCS